VVFEALALLVAVPVHEEAVGEVDQKDGDGHIDADSEGCDAGQESEEQADTAEKLGENCEGGEGRRDLHAVGEDLHRAGKAGAAPPAENLLRAVGEEGDAEGEAE
jgi:hypothetical protein